MDAAAYTNRALAYAPNDPALLAAATSLGRREAGRRALRRGVPLLLGTVAFAALGFWGSRALVRRPPTPPVVRVPESPSATGATVVTPPSPRDSSPRPAVSLSAAVPLPAPPVVKPPAVVPPKPVERSLVIRTLRPPFGVTLTLDGEPVAQPTAGARLPMTRESHTVKLTCANDACEPDVRTIAASTEDEILDVSLTVRPATLVVDADGDRRFQLREDPTIVFGAREVVRVPMKGSLATMHVVDLAAPDRVEAVTLTAGKQSRVSFTAP